MKLICSFRWASVNSCKGPVCQTVWSTVCHHRVTRKVSKINSIEKEGRGNHKRRAAMGGHGNQKI